MASAPSRLVTVVVESARREGSRQEKGVDVVPARLPSLRRRRQDFRAESVRSSGMAVESSLRFATKVHATPDR